MDNKLLASVNNKCSSSHDGDFKLDLKFLSVDQLPLKV